MLRIKEIYFDIQDRSTFIGFPTIFVCLAGQNQNKRSTINPLYAVGAEKSMPIEEILDEILKYNCYIVMVTGGNPLLEEKTHSLISALINKNFLVLIETDGTESIKNINSKSIVLLDVKCPGETNFNNFLMDNLTYVRPKDQLRFYITSSRDYNWSKELIFKNMLFEKCNLLFFADDKDLSSKTLSEWIISDQLPVRLGTKINLI